MKRLGLHGSGRKRNGRRIMLMMSFFKVMMIQMKRTTRIEVRIGRMISCSLSSKGTPSSTKLSSDPRLYDLPE